MEDITFVKSQESIHKFDEENTFNFDKYLSLKKNESYNC